MAKIKIIEMIDKAALGGGQTAVLFLARSLDPELFEVAVSSGGPGPLVEAAGRHGLRPFAARPREPFQPSGRRRPSPGSWPSIRTPYPRRLCRALRASGRPAGSDSIIVHTLHGIHYLHYRNPALQLFSIWQERFLSRTTDALVLVCQSDMSRAKRYRLAPRDRLVAIPNGLDIRQPDGPPPAVDFSRRPGLGREDRSSGRRRLAAKRGSSPLRAAPRILPPPSPRPGLPWWGRDRWRNSGIGPRRSASMAGSSSLERARMSVPSCRSSTSSSCRRSGKDCLTPSSKPRRRGRPIVATSRSTASWDEPLSVRRASSCRRRTPKPWGARRSCVLLGDPASGGEARPRRQGRRKISPRLK